MTANSHVAGSPQVVLLDYTIGEALTRAVRQWPGDDALASYHQNDRLTWRELDDQVDEVTHGLLSLGVATPASLTLRYLASVT